MPIKKCRFGFSCAGMMLQPDLTAEDCPNRDTCGILHELTPEERVELVWMREIEHQEWEASREERQAERVREIETLRVNQREAAVLMLRSR